MHKIISSARAFRATEPRLFAAAHRRISAFGDDPWRLIRAPRVDRSESNRRSHSVPRLRRSCGCAAWRALIARRRPLAGASARAKNAGSCSLHLSARLPPLLSGFISSLRSGSVAKPLALGRAASPVLRCPRPATAGVLGPGDSSAHPSATSDGGSRLDNHLAPS
jgi:hypothetical protein